MPASYEIGVGAAPARDVYSVSRLNREVRVLLERGLGVLWVEGELSNFSQPASGHWYFSLKDRDAQLRCAMFRTRNVLVGFTPRAGAQLLVRGRISVYEPRGEYQLIVEHLEEAGVGALRREFERLKSRLAAEGLFALERKRTCRVSRGASASSPRPQAPRCAISCTFSRGAIRPRRCSSTPPRCRAPQPCRRWSRRCVARRRAPSATC